EYVRNNPHATATIIAVWSEPSRHGDRIYGRITFTHHMDAKVVVCEIEAYLGTPQDNLVVGSTIDIVPRKDRCQAPMFTKRILSTDG
ncbi:hypothetical protein Q6316_28815, partial [Klebsiella pneumoniae]|uniref:hypothetical protein n=1 Tax=Klebsiella pneumoniae TaxID=573 RepID=UPI0027305626